LDAGAPLRTIAFVSPSRGGVLALTLLAVGCAGGTHTVRRDALPPPAPGSRAGTSNGAGPVPGPARVQARVPPADAARRAVQAAGRLVGARSVVVGGIDYGDGCAALVRAAFAEAELALPKGDARALHEAAKLRFGARRGRPLPGDLAFLADRPGGPVEHVGLVERVGADGTVVLLHRTERGVARIRVNAAQPWKARDPSGRALNDVLIVGGGRVTVGRLLVAFSTIR
jgi:hypothetical protein